MTGDGTFKILSIDPGTTNTGYAVIEATIQTLQIVRAVAWSNEEIGRASCRERV